MTPSRPVSTQKIAQQARIMVDACARACTGLSRLALAHAGGSARVRAALDEIGKEAQAGTFARPGSRPGIDAQAGPAVHPSVAARR
jgi:hypothetical protein